MGQEKRTRPDLTVRQIPGLAASAGGRRRHDAWYEQTDRVSGSRSVANRVGSAYSSAMTAPLLPPAAPAAGVDQSSRVLVDDDPTLSDHLRTARSVGLGLLSGSLVILAVTGLALFLWYVPDPVTAGPASPAVRRSDLLQDTHRLAAWLAVFTAICTGVVVLIERGLARRWFSASLGPLTGLVALSALVSGLPLAWNQLGLRAVTIGSRFDGYEFLFGDEVRFVLVDSGTVSVADLATAMAGHLAAAVALAVVATMVWRLRHEHATALTDLERAERLARRSDLRRF